MVLLSTDAMDRKYMHTSTVERRREDFNDNDVYIILFHISYVNIINTFTPMLRVQST